VCGHRLSTWPNECQTPSKTQTNGQTNSPFASVRLSVVSIKGVHPMEQSAILYRNLMGNDENPVAKPRGGLGG